MIMLGGDKKRLAASIIAGGPDGAAKNEEAYEKMAGEPEEHESALHYAANDVMKAIHGKDVVALKEALHGFFEIADSMPHEEGEHLTEEG